ncbi:MAG: potassium channel family protein [Maribacter sp.]|nr:potassium channel family protein [Maribacter sp.]
MLKKVDGLLKDNSVSSVLLLISSIVFIFAIPAFDFPTPVISLVLFSIIIFLAAYSISKKVVFIGIAAILIEIATRATDFKYIHYLAELFTNLFIIYIVGLVIKDLLARKNVDIYSLVEAINGYLLLSIMFIGIVAFCDLYFPGAYNAAGKTEMELVYYTMITLTTAGYGDITPQLPISQSLSMLIAVTGQFYVAVIVAILVGKFSSNTVLTKEE